MATIVIGTVLAFSLPLLAHHGNASYDVTKKPTIKGVVTEFIWANPHCYLRFDATDENGNVVHWLVEASNPPDQTREGWTKNTFKPGDQVEITMGSVARNGQPIGRFGDRIVINGKVLKGAQTAP
jgi:Family of unknown function (DUF6152)